MHKLHLPLKLFAVDDCLTIFHFIGGVSSWSLRFWKYLDRVVWFLSHELVKECLWLYSPCFQFQAEIPMLLCSMGETHTLYITFFELHSPFWYSYRKPHLVLHYSNSIHLVTSCCGCLRYYAYCLYKNYYIYIYIYIYLFSKWRNYIL